MGLFQENNKAKVIFNIDDKIVEMDCYVEKIFFDRIKLSLPKAARRYLDYLKSGQEIIINIFSHAGIITQSTIILTSPSEKEFTVEYDPDEIKIENRRTTKRYSANCDLTIVRPLLGNIDTKLIDISVKGLRYYSDVPLETGAEFECVVRLTKDNEIAFIGKVLDNKGLPIGVYRMVIIKIDFKSKDALIKYCENVLNK